MNEKKEQANQNQQKELTPQEKIERADRISGGKDRSYSVPSGRGGAVDPHVTQEQNR